MAGFSFSGVPLPIFGWGGGSMQWSPQSSVGWMGSPLGGDNIDNVTAGGQFAGRGTLASYNKGLEEQGVGWAQGLAGLGSEGAAAAKQNMYDLHGYQDQLSGLAKYAKRHLGQFDYNQGYAKRALADAFADNPKVHDDLLQRALSRAGAQEAAAGIATSGTGAGITGDVAANFENAWWTQQIGREAQGAQTATGLQNQITQNQQGLLGEAGQFYGKAADIQNQGLEGYLKSIGVQGQNMKAAIDALKGFIDTSHYSIST